MKTSPEPSTATPVGPMSPEPTVVWVPSGFTSTTRSLPESAMKTSPEPSTATPVGSMSPEPTVVWVPPGRHLHHLVVVGVGDEDVARRRPPPRPRG